MRAITVSLALAMTLLAAVAASAGEGDLLWKDTFDRSGGVAYDDARAAAAAGNLVFASGNSGDETGSQDAIVRGYDQETGRLVWQDLYDAPPAGNGDSLLDLAAADGRLFAVGQSGVPGGRNFVVRAYRARTGLLFWKDEVPGAEFSGFGQYFTRAISVAVEGSRVFAAGQLMRTPEDGDFLVRAYDARTGGLLWQDQLDGGQAGRARFVAAERGRAFVVGEVGSCAEDFDLGGDCDFIARTYDARTGRLLWQDQLDLGTNDFGRAVSVVGERVVAVGYGGDFGHGDFLVRAYDAGTGALAWEDREDGAGKMDMAQSVTAKGRRVFAVGFGGDCNFLLAPGGDCDGLVRAYDAETGALEWEDQVDTGADDFLGAFAMTGGVVAQGNRLLVSGTGGDCLWYDFSDCDVLLLVYRSHDGSLLRQAQYDNAGGDDSAQDMAADRSRAFVMGAAERAAGPPFTPPDADFLVLAYDTRGDNDDD